jgi:hypothetical protein
VEKVAQGKYASLAETSRRNGIKGGETLVRWIKKYGREDVLPKRVKADLQPRLGGRKLLHMLAPKLVEDGIKLGRDKFFGVLRERGLLLERLPAFMPKNHKLAAQPARVPQPGKGHGAAKPGVG